VTRLFCFRAAEFNPIVRIGELAQAGIPAILIHGDADKVVPLKENSGTDLPELSRQLPLPGNHSRKSSTLAPSSRFA
jgi:hypothetical protein